jgi:hypothetical protein
MMFYRVSAFITPDNKKDPAPLEDYRVRISGEADK